MAGIDYKNKEITIHGSNGACAETEDIYSLIVKKDIYDNFERKIVLNIMIKHERDDAKGICYELKYKVIGQSVKLISKKESSY